MKHIKKLLASVLAAALVLPTAVPAAFADGVRERPSISVGTADPDYIGGIGEIDWGDTDWGAFKNIDWTGAADMTADELYNMFAENTDFNVFTTNGTLTFKADEGTFDGEPTLDSDIADYSEGAITFHEGNTVIISSAKETFDLIGETTLNIPDGSSVMVISAYKTETEEEDSYPTVIHSDTTLNINTNETGNLAVAAFNSGTISSWGIYAGNLNVYGTGVVASYGGKAQAQSTGVDADYSISVKGASLVGVGAPGDGGSVGVMVEDIKKEDGTFGAGTVSATDDAVIIGAGGIGTDYTYGIYTSSIEARNNSFIYACGAKVDGTDGDFSSIGLITAIADERTRTITSDNGSGIYASGKGEGSVGIGEFYFSEAENRDAEFGGVRIVIDDSENESSKSSIMAYGDMAAYKQSSDSSVNESKFKAPTGSVKVLGVDDTEDGSMNLVEFDTEKHTYTYNNNNATYIYVTKGETADYSLYYNPADSSFYKSYDETNGYSDKVENVAGATGDGKNLTLTSDFEFYTSADLGLVLPEHTDININEGEHPIIVAGSFTDNDFTAGIYSMKGFALSINGGSRVGALHVSGGYGNNKDSFGIYSDGIVNISGKGMLECVGGCVNVESGSYDSVGLYARRNILIFDTRVYADGGRIYADNEGADGESVGMLSGALDESEVNAGVSDGIGIYGDAYVSASAAGGSGNAASFGCITSYLLASDKSRLMLNTYGESMYTVGLGIQLNGNSGIDIFENASVSGKASGGDISYGLSETVFEGEEEFDGTKRIAVNIYNDGSMKFEGDTQAIAATRRMFGSISVTDGEDNPLTYSEDMYGYVDSESKPAQKAVIKGLPDADYAIYYSPDTGFRKNNKDGDLLTADELPEGMSAEGNTITLNDVEFHTTKKIALIADGGVTLNVPKNSRATLSVFNSDPVDPEDSEASNVFGVMLNGDSVIQADGTMAVAANGEGRAFGLASYGNLTVKGEGELIAAEFFGADNSWALMSTENITIEDSAHVYAYANAIVGDKEPNVSSSMSRQLTVKDNAVLDTSGGYNSRSIGIWDGYDLVTEDNASVIAGGSLIMYGNAETKPGAIRASGNSTVTVECDYNGDGENVLDWGIMRGTGMEGDAQIYVTDNASVSAYTVAENGGAVSGAKAADGVSVVGGNAQGDSGTLEYKGDTYVIAGTEDTAHYILFTSGERETADYAICYSAETGFRKDRFSGDPLTADELPEGMSADGNTLTLNNVDFVTTADAALVLRDGVTVNVPENTSSRIAAVSDNSEVKSVYGLEFDGNSTIQADGLLSVSAEGADMAIGIGVWGDLTITGDGEVTAEEKSVSEPSYALLCTDNLVIKDSVQVYANAYAPNGPSERVYGVICRQLNVKDDAYLDTTGGEDAMGIWIWDGYDIVAEDNARINAYGGIIMEGDAGINPGAIHASGESIIMVVSFREGDGDSVLYWGICGVTRKESGEGDPYAEDNDARICVTGGARVLAYSLEENGGAVNKVRAVDGVSVIGGNSADESDALEYKDDTYVIAGTEDTANYIVFRSAEKEIVDYPLYFDGETGKLYKKFSHSFSTGEATFSEPVEVPGAICEKNKLTLTSDFRFCTTGEDGLALGEGTTLYVPEGESPSIRSAVSGIVLSEHIGGTSGIYCCGNNTINVDGSLTVTAGDGVNIDSWGITDAGVGKDINITGKGSLTVYGGNITYDETVTEDRPRGTSCAIGAYDDINISIAELNAIGGNAYKGSFGIVADYPGTEPHTLTVSGGSHVVAKSGRCDNAEESISCGGAANHLIIKDNSSVTMYVPGAGEKYYAAGLMIYNGDNYGNGKIELSNGGSLTVKAGNTTTSSGVAPTYLGQVDASIDGSSTFTAEGATFASLAELMGVSVVSDGMTVTFDREKYGYVDADGNLVKKISVEPAETEPSPAPTEAPAPSRGGGSGRGSSGTSAAKPTASPTPTAAPEATESPEPTEAPSETDKTEPTDAPEVGGLPFVDVTASDWFYNAVKAAYTEGLVSGVTETEFAPNVTLTRGMLTAIIGRMGGAETTDGSTVFTDVDANAYYAPYVAWAAENGIVAGFTDGTFRPDENVTREQTAAIIWRYMQYIGEDVSVGEDTNILSYTDAADVSEYAIPAIQWACGDGIINGYPDGSLAPKSGITRAEFAAMISKIALI